MGTSDPGYDAGKQWTLDELSATPEERWRFETKAAICTVAHDAYRERTGQYIADDVWLEGLADRLLVLVAAERSSRQAWAAEAEYRRLEAEFEANGERWSNTIVGRDGHEYVNGAAMCACGAPCPRLRDWSDHLLASRMIEGRPLCACVTDEQAAQLGPGFSRPQCAVHPTGDDQP